MATEFDTKPMKLKKDKKRALDGVSDDDAKAAKKARKAAKAAKKAAAALQSTPTNSDSGDVPDRPSTPTKNFSVDNLAALAKLKENAKEAKKKSGGSSAADDSGDGSASDAQSKWLVDNEVKIHDSAVETKVCLDFNAAPFPKTLITLLNKQGFPSPSAVQGAAWPVSMTGTDVLAIAKTGSGKTLGYLLPALTIAAEHKHASKGSPLALCMSPTRELALQINQEAQKFGQPLGCRSVAVYGGAPKWGQASQLQRGCEIIIATPGRMLDMLDMHNKGGNPITNLNQCRVLILDEADRMLDMGFEKDIMQIVQCMGAASERQTLLFTATWPKSVQRIASNLLKPDRVKITVGNGGDKLTANKAVTQNVKVIEGRDKWPELLKLMEEYKEGGPMHNKRVMIFCNTKKDVNGIGQHLWDEGYAADTVSGDRGQREREAVIAAFRRGTTTMVVCTDVAARGIDVTDVAAVINYDFPRDACDDYIHRIGRTGRAGASGVAHTLFTRQDGRYAKELVQILTDADQNVSDALKQLAQQGGGGGGYQKKPWRGGGGRGGGRGGGFKRW
jgi:ATP-dependent RNA helicase DDX5/DBP2